MLVEALVGEEAPTTNDVVARRMEGTRIASHLARTIAIQAPGPITPETWEAVAESDRAFMAALKTWEQSGTDEDKAKLREAYRAVLKAWSEA